MERAPSPATSVAKAPRGHGIANRIIPALLRSPVLHQMLSRNLMLITFAGRQSGKQFTTPVTYMSTETGVAFFTNGQWWTNLKGGAPVMLRLRGRELSGRANPVEDREAVAREARTYLVRYGTRNASRIGLTLPAQSDPSDAELGQALRDHVVVYVTTEES